MNIKPSARKSIHNNCSTCNSHCHKNMGVYGLREQKKREKKSEDVSQEQGVDEVDNIMSKMARQASPRPMRRNNDVKYRSNSFGINNDESCDESDNENILSKSSPATFSYSSEDLFVSALQNELLRSRNESNQSINVSPQRRHNISYEIQHKRYHLSPLEENNPIRKASNQIVVAMIIILLAFMIFLYSQHISDQPKTNNVYDKLRFDSDVKDLKEKYKVKENSILQVKTGVATIFEKQDTASFIFAYNSDSINFNPIIFNNFVEDIAATTSRYLRNESKEVHVTVDTSNLMMSTTKDFMNQYQDKVIKTGVMLVKDIDSIPSQLAMAFHYYCDEYNPLVKRSAIFFTLNLANCSIISDKKSSHEYIEKCLANKWSTVGEEKIGPLLTRVVNIVVDVSQTF